MKVDLSDFRKVLTVNFEEFNIFFKQTFRKKLASYEGCEKDEQVLNTTCHILSTLNDKGLRTFGLEQITCNKCKKNYCVYIEDEKDLVRYTGNDFFPNYCCPYCGKRLLDED